MRRCRPGLARTASVTSSAKLQLAPQITEAQVAYQNGDLRHAEKILRSVLAIAPTNVDATVLLAILCARTGKQSAAVIYLQNALRIRPDCYEAHVALSTLLFAQGNPEAAVKHGERAIEIQPEELESYRHLARDLTAHGRSAEALTYLNQALDRFNDDPLLYKDIAINLTDLGKTSEALAAWQNALSLDPNLLIGWLKMGGIQIVERRFDEAILSGREAVRIAPDSADALILLGISLVERDGTREAERLLRRALEINPDEPIAVCALALALQAHGKFEEARPLLEQTIELLPTNGQAYHALVWGKKATEEDQPLIQRIRSASEIPNAGALDKSYMHFALGKAQEDLKDFEGAMTDYDRANEYAAEAWYGNVPANREWYTRLVDTMIEAFTPSSLEALQAKGLQSAKPLLIVGMIRSGTSLVEQVVSSHSAIYGAGELMHWHERAPDIFDLEAKSFDSEILLREAQSYLELLERLGPGSPFVTDKLPHNYSVLGPILGALPNAKVIHVRRNPIDNCLSIYTTAFNYPPDFAQRKEDIVFWYRQYERLMAHWKTVLPADSILDVDYEDLVANREDVTRKMIEFLGLDWEDSCLHHEHNERNVNTPSVWQVRQPIYKTSVERWRKFEPWLGEFEQLCSHT